MIKAGLYVIRFAHHKKERNLPNGQVLTVPVATICRIVKEDQELGAGKSTPHKKFDPFCYEKGRRVALTRALAEAFPGPDNKSLRTSIWGAYWGRK